MLSIASERTRRTGDRFADDDAWFTVRVKSIKIPLPFDSFDLDSYLGHSDFLSRHETGVMLIPIPNQTDTRVHQHRSSPRERTMDVRVQSTTN